MSMIAEAQGHVLSIGGAEGSRKAQIARAYRRLSHRFTFNRVKDLAYADARVRVRADEIEELRRVDTARAIEKAAGDEFRTITDQIAAVEALLLSDQDFYRVVLDALRAVARGDNRAVDCVRK